MLDYLETTTTIIISMAEVIREFAISSLSSIANFPKKSLGHSFTVICYVVSTILSIKLHTPTFLG